jgi:hypothetical protein
VLQNEIPMGHDSNFKSFYFENKQEAQPAAPEAARQHPISFSSEEKKFQLHASPQFNKKTFDFEKLTAPKTKLNGLIKSHNKLQSLIKNVNTIYLGARTPLPPAEKRFVSGANFLNSSSSNNKFQNSLNFALTPNPQFSLGQLGRYA